MHAALHRPQVLVPGSAARLNRGAQEEEEEEQPRQRRSHGLRKQHRGEWTQPSAQDDDPG